MQTDPLRSVFLLAWWIFIKFV